MSSKEFALETLQYSPEPNYSDDSKIGTIVNLVDIINGFCRQRAVEENPTIACTYMMGPHIAFALESGNVFLEFQLWIHKREPL